MSEVLSPFSLSQEKIGSLRKTIERNQGEATMVIHPFFASYQIPPGYNSLLALTMHRELSRDGVLFLLEKDKNQDLQRTSSALKGTILEVQTRDADPRTIFDSNVMDDSLRNPQTRDEYFWRRINELGVIKLNLAGRLLDYVNVSFDVNRGDFYKKWAKLMRGSLEKESTQRWLSMGLLPYGCVGYIATRCIQEGIDVEMTPAASPQGILDLSEDVEKTLNRLSIFSYL